MSTTYSISDLARELDITTRAIRFYEEQGLLSPERRGQERIYSPRDKVSLKLILRGKRIGFSLAECRELIELYDPTSGNQKQLHSMLAKIAERREQLEQQLLDIEQMKLELDTAEERCTQALEQTIQAAMSLPSHVRLVEVGPRDGLQNEAQPISVADKVQLVDALSAAGLGYIEVGSFVSPKWVPQMAGSAEVFAQIQRKPGVTYGALAPNLRGFEDALAAGVKEVAVFAAASEAFSQRNINCSISESLERFVPIMDAARQHGVSVRGYVSCVLGCPYEGQVAPEQVAAVARELFAMGCYEVSLGDTIGTGTAGATRWMFEVVGAQVPRDKLAGHFHDTYGQAIANIYASLEEGIQVFDSSIAGLGGCPYAKGASGNVATEDVLYLLNGLGIETGIDMDKLILAGQQICTVLGRPTGSRVAKARSAETQLTDFFGEDVLRRVRLAETRNRIEKNKKLPQGSYPLVGSRAKKQISAQKNTFALDPGWGSPKTAVKGHGCQKQQ
eukprot:gene14312-16889_t